MNYDAGKKISGWRKVNFKKIHHFIAATFLFFFSLGFLVILGVSPVRAENLTADDILNKVDDLYRGTSSHGMMTMEVVTGALEKNAFPWNSGPRAKINHSFIFLPRSKKKGQPHSVQATKSGITCPK